MLPKIFITTFSYLLAREKVSRYETERMVWVRGEG